MSTFTEVGNEDKMSDSCPSMWSEKEDRVLQIISNNPDAWSYYVERSRSPILREEVDKICKWKWRDCNLEEEEGE